MYYDAKQVRMSQEKHLLSGFPLSYQLSSAGQSVHQGRSASTDYMVAQRETLLQMLFLTDSNLFCIIGSKKKSFVFGTFDLG